ncbi:MAG: hypothetical protein MR601_07140 [Erysipelotrichaceae bacterium]|nr:hypothetical protein [Erysipelotrichaceae bacterium]
MNILKSMYGKEWQHYLRIEPIRDISELELKVNSMQLLYSNFSLRSKTFFDQIKKYESNFSKEYKVKKARYGYSFTLLLPEGEWNNSRLIKITSMFVKMVVGKETGLKYISYSYSINKAKYIYIYIYDREYRGKHFVKKYKRDFVINKNTGRACSKTDKDAVILHHKGDVMKDKSGKEITEEFKSTKTRIFCYKDEQFLSWLNMFRDYFFQALLKAEATLKTGFILRRKNLNKALNRFKKRIIIANNKLIQYVQNEVNYWYEQSLRSPEAAEIYKDAYEVTDKIETSFSKAIEKLLKKYRNIFAEDEYEHENIKYKLDGFRCDVVEENLIKLKDIFNLDLQTVLKDNGVVYECN